jgi:hypothetical protein
VQLIIYLLEKQTERGGRKGEKNVQVLTEISGRDHRIYLFGIYLEIKRQYLIRKNLETPATRIKIPLWVIIKSYIKGASNLLARKNRCRGG